MEISESVGEGELNDAVDVLETAELEAELHVGGAGRGKCSVRVDAIP